MVAGHLSAALAEMQISKQGCFRGRWELRLRGSTFA